MMTSRMLVLAALSHHRLVAVLHRLPAERRRGRPWSRSLSTRVLIACTALRTNLTIRELAASFAVSRSTAHRIVATMIPRLAALADRHRPRDRRESWVVDGTVIPTRDHRYAARSKNYRWSCNAQILVRRRDLRIVAVAAGGPGNRNDPIHYRSSQIEACANTIVAFLPMVVTEASSSSPRLGFDATESCVIERGVDIADVEHASSTRSRGSRIGGSYETIAAAAATSPQRSKPSPSFTISTSTSCGTTFSPRTRSATAARG